MAEKRIPYLETVHSEKCGEFALPDHAEGEDGQDTRHFIDAQDQDEKRKKEKIEKFNQEMFLTDQNFAPEGWKTQTLPLFSTPLLICSPSAIPYEELKKVLVIPEEKYFDGSKTAGYKYLSITNNKQILNDENLKYFKKNVMEAVKMYVAILGGLQGNFFIKNSWIVKSKPGYKARSHCHPNSLFSGVYYIQTDPKCGDIVFEYKDMVSPAICTNMDIHRKYYTILNSSIFSFKPKNNQIVLFPSDLSHRVSKNLSSIDRISIAFDIYIDGVIGSAGAYWMETKVSDVGQDLQDDRPWVSGKASRIETDFEISKVKKVDLDK